MESVAQPKKKTRGEFAFEVLQKQLGVKRDNLTSFLDWLRSDGKDDWPLPEETKSPDGSPMSGCIRRIGENIKLVINPSLLTPERMNLVPLFVDVNYLLDTALGQKSDLEKLFLPK